ncbi:MULTISPECIES: efflux RND transporter periplasmic adaptor subunit [unclassified Arsukibacterium]|uniref:efflux RND transporter periplasmic adaptor subunit n=1 Tax=unclassified Arsukibacterium TaxID=2635278 RepID=UPI000C8A4094|nr:MULTISPECIES: efflux RND transporter periplasmic adaptor subunit [unclassified Arsukibacterium]MAA93708.1 efflux transporter periplasmic adaptor subunit [Rheinheimera sp.]HAW92023.1 efflux transporter periplasmic adaptor subunit [Candidatus Azambacteria bacterium]|tara:strand:+ start:7236 stop:8477 length:1242 start_codon:yes stop_codon:yes gene_type:complete
MSSFFVKVILPVVVVVVAIMAAVGLGKMRQPPQKSEETRPAILVNTGAISPDNIVYQISSQGMVTPKLETSLISEVNGRVVAVAEEFVAGGFFKKGDLLVQVEKSDYLTNVKAAQAALANAQAMLAEEKARVKVAEEEWRSFTDGNAPALGLRQPQLASALASVQSAEAEVERANRDLARTEIRAPYDGMVRTRAANLGQFISRGTALGSIVGTDIAEIRLPLTDTDMAFLTMPGAGESDTITSDNNQVMLSSTIAGQQVQWPAKLVRTEGILDERSRVIYVVAEVADPYQRRNQTQPVLNFGRFVAATITGTQAEQVVKVARHLLLPGNKVLVVDNDNTLQFRQVTVDRATAEAAYITNGLQSSDQLVLSAISNPLAGTMVRIAGDNTVEDHAEQPTQLADAAAAVKQAEGQ